MYNPSIFLSFGIQKLYILASLLLINVTRYLNDAPVIIMMMISVSMIIAEFRYFLTPFFLRIPS